MDEIIELKNKIIQLQKIKNDLQTENKLKNNSLEHNLTIIKTMHEKKKKILDNNYYCKSALIARIQDQELLPFMEAVMNSLNIINKRLLALENK